MQILKSIFLITQTLILLVFSFEVEFMPNYIHHSDKWHVVFPYLIFSGILIVEFLWICISMIRNKTWVIDLSIGIIFSFIGLQIMMSSSGFLQGLGLIISLVVAIYFVIQLYLDSRMLEKK